MAPYGLLALVKALPEQGEQNDFLPEEGRLVNKIPLPLSSDNHKLNLTCNHRTQVIKLVLSLRFRIGRWILSEENCMR